MAPARDSLTMLNVVGKKEVDNMNTTRFSSSGDQFPLLDLTAVFAWKTDASISFDVGRMSTNIHPHDDPSFVMTGFEIIGA